MDKHLQTAEDIAYFLDGKFKVLGLRFGMDGVFGFVPIVGDAISSILSLYIVWIGVQMRLPSRAISDMLSNIIADFFIGLVPVVGDLLDFFHHANLKNLKILKQYAKGNVIEGAIVS